MKVIKQHDDNIKVAVRVRPPLNSELQSGNTFDMLNADV